MKCEFNQKNWKMPQQQAQQQAQQFRIQSEELKAETVILNGSSEPHFLYEFNQKNWKQRPSTLATYEAKIRIQSEELKAHGYCL